MTWKEIAKVPQIAKDKRRWLRLKGNNDGIYYTIGFWNNKDWIEIGTSGQALINVTHWAPFS